mmetsp:Transcript_12282/g.13585  ORF Transcript_12282/g.13585 Transcript_12282/m.13585 type:complete len:161 (-) Transcript_12282:354-836(-)
MLFPGARRKQSKKSPGITSQVQVLSHTHGVRLQLKFILALLVYPITTQRHNNRNTYWHCPISIVIQAASSCNPDEATDGVAIVVGGNVDGCKVGGTVLGANVVGEIVGGTDVGGTAVGAKVEGTSSHVMLVTSNPTITLVDTTEGKLPTLSPSEAYKSEL